LGASNLCIQEVDKQVLRDEIINHFSEDYNGKIKVLGSFPATTINLMKELLEAGDLANKDNKLALAVKNTLYSLTEDHGNTEGYFENFLYFLSKLNCPITLDAFY
jgi:hypothetical protein